MENKLYKYSALRLEVGRSLKFIEIYLWRGLHTFDTLWLQWRTEQPFLLSINPFDADVMSHVPLH